MYPDQNNQSPNTTPNPYPPQPQTGPFPNAASGQTSVPSPNSQTPAWNGQPVPQQSYAPPVTYTQPYPPQDLTPTLPPVPQTQSQSQPQTQSSKQQNSYNQSHVNRHKRSKAMIIALALGVIIAGIAAYMIFSIVQDNKAIDESKPNEASQQAIDPSDADIEGNGTTNPVE